jgi:hypothetical protein
MPPLVPIGTSSKPWRNADLTSCTWPRPDFIVNSSKPGEPAGAFPRPSQTTAGDRFGKEQGSSSALNDPLRDRIRPAVWKGQDVRALELEVLPVENPVFVPPPTVEGLTGLSTEEPALWRKWAAFREQLQRPDRFVWPAAMGEVDLATPL